MKTPKREREDIVPIDEPVYDCMGGICDIYSNWEPVHIAHARWKRKNRVKQLKHTIRKYKEGTMLPELVHIRYAYKWLQKLKKPTPNAEVICWHTYLAELKTIRDSINRAVEDAAICLGEAIANRERQEQGND